MNEKETTLLAELDREITEISKKLKVFTESENRLKMFLATAKEEDDKEMVESIDDQIKQIRNNRIISKKVIQSKKAEKLIIEEKNS